MTLEMSTRRKCRYEDSARLPTDGLRRAIATESRIRGAPDLVVEILSPSTAEFDRREKLHAEERAGVRECRLVDPVAHRIEQYARTEGAFRRLPDAGDELRLHVAPDVLVRPADLW